MAREQDTDARQTAPSDTASPGFHLPDTLDWSSQFAQLKNRLVVIPHSVFHSADDAPVELKGTNDSRRSKDIGLS